MATPARTYILGTKGKDTIGSGKGADKISIGSSSVGGGMVVGSDVVFAIGSGMLKLTGAKGKAVTIISGDTETEYVNGVIPGSETVLPDDTTPADSGVTVTLESSFTGNFSLTAYNTTAEIAAQNIDASDVRNSINIYADNSANVIRAAKGGGNIYAGKGAGNDSIRFYQYDGDETVYNIGNDDQIILNNCTTQNVSVSGSDVIITTSSEETITLKDGTGKRIWITGQNWQTYTAETASNGNVAVLWFAEDDTNFTTTSDLDSLMETPIANSAGALSVGGGDSLSPFAYDFALAHTNDK